jgi:radical SAM protein with 4Fe4S-binding SPASM domain
MTRDCIDPWIAIEIKTNGDVRPCCVRVAAGNLKSQSLAQILNGQAMRSVRESLLSATPDNQCGTCRLRTVTTKEELAKRVSAVMEGVCLPGHFDSASYLAANPDVARAGTDPSKHYLQSGRFEGRPLFP